MGSETTAIRAGLPPKKKYMKKRTKQKRKTDVAVSTKVRTTNNSSERSSAAPDRNSIPQGRQRVKMARPTRWNFWHAFFFILHCAQCSFSLFPAPLCPTLRRVFSQARLDRFVMRLQSFSSLLSFQPRDRCPSYHSVEKKACKLIRVFASSRIDSKGPRPLFQ